MKKNSLISWRPATAALVLLTLGPSTIHAEEAYRIWTNQEGRTIEAKLVAAANDMVTLQKRGGGNYDVALSGLSDADSAYVSEWLTRQEKMEAIENAPKPSGETLLATTGALIFSDDFGKEIASDWRANIGEWAITDGALMGKELAKDEHAAVFKRALPMKDAVIEFEVKLDGAKNISFGIDDDADHICRLSLDPEGFSVRRDDHDHEGPDKAVPFPRVALEAKPGEWQTVRIEILGETMLGQVQDSVSFGSDPLLASAKTKAGFVVSGETASFRNLRVWEALPNEDWEKTQRKLERDLERE